MKNNIHDNDIVPMNNDMENKEHEQLIETIPDSRQFEQEKSDLEIEMKVVWIRLIIALQRTMKGTKPRNIQSILSRAS